MSHKYHIFQNSPDFQESFLAFLQTHSFQLHQWIQMFSHEKTNKKDILLRKYNTRVKIRKFNIDVILLSDTLSIFKSLFLVIIHSGSHIEFNCHVSLMSFSLEQALSVSLSFFTLTFLQSLASYFMKFSLLQISLMFHHD